MGAEDLLCYNKLSFCGCGSSGCLGTRIRPVGERIWDGRCMVIRFMVRMDYYLKRSGVKGTMRTLNSPFRQGEAERELGCRLGSGSWSFQVDYGRFEKKVFFSARNVFGD